MTLPTIETLLIITLVFNLLIFCAELKRWIGRHNNEKPKCARCQSEFKDATGICKPCLMKHFPNVYPL